MAKQDSNNGAVGDVKYSLLPPAAFLKVNGETWILMDGRSINGSRLHELTGMDTIPDARGLFFRALQAGRKDKKGDPEGERAAGSMQGDQFKQHDHGGGSHGHAMTGASTIDTWGGHVVVGGNNIGGKGIPASGAIIAKEGGDETRPVNMALYAYIKISD